MPPEEEEQQEDDDWCWLWWWLALTTVFTLFIYLRILHAKCAKYVTNNVR